MGGPHLPRPRRAADRFRDVPECRATCRGRAPRARRRQGARARLQQPRVRARHLGDLVGRPRPGTRQPLVERPGDRARGRPDPTGACAQRPRRTARACTDRSVDTHRRPRSPLRRRGHTGRGQGTGRRTVARHGAVHLRLVRPAEGGRALAPVRRRQPAQPAQPLAHAAPDDLHGRTAAGHAGLYAVVPRRRSLQPDHAAHPGWAAGHDRRPVRRGRGARTHRAGEGASLGRRADHGRTRAGPSRLRSARPVQPAVLPPWAAPRCRRRCSTGCARNCRSSGSEGSPTPGA